MNLPDVDRLAAVDITDDDVLVATFHAPISRQTADELSRLLKRVWPRNMVVVIDAVELTVHRPGPADEDRPTARYDALAEVLLRAPDPVRALASLLGDHEARLDIAMDRLHHVECALNEGRAR